MIVALYAVMTETLKENFQKKTLMAIAYFQFSIRDSKVFRQPSEDADILAVLRSSIIMMFKRIALHCT